jgi:hypothetical protein
MFLIRKKYSTMNLSSDVVANHLYNITVINPHKLDSFIVRDRFWRSAHYPLTFAGVNIALKRNRRDYDFSFDVIMVSTDLKRRDFKSHEKSR